MPRLRTFYCVTSRFFNDGTMTASITANKKDYYIPQATATSTPTCDVYNDWFESYMEAKDFVKQTAELRHEMKNQRPMPGGPRGRRF